MSGLECIVSVLEARVWVQLSRSSELLLKDLLSDPWAPGTDLPGPDLQQEATQAEGY